MTPPVNSFYQPIIPWNRKYIMKNTESKAKPIRIFRQKKVIEFFESMGLKTDILLDGKSVVAYMKHPMFTSDIRVASHNKIGLYMAKGGAILLRWDGLWLDDLKNSYKIQLANQLTVQVHDKEVDYSLNCENRYLNKGEDVGKYMKRIDELIAQDQKDRFNKNMDDILDVLE